MSALLIDTTDSFCGPYWTSDSRKTFATEVRSALAGQMYYFHKYTRPRIISGTCNI